MRTENLTPRTRLIMNINAHAATEPSMKRVQEMTVGDRLTRLELRDMENWNLMATVVSDSLAEALEEDDERQNLLLEEELPAIVDRQSFLAYVSMVARQIKQKTITGIEGRSLLYAAQLSLAAIGKQAGG